MFTNNSWNTPDLTSDGQLLIGSSTGRPSASLLTSSANTLTIQTGHGTINLDLVQPVSVAYGGTGQTVLTVFGVLIGEGSNSVNVTAAGTNGQVLIASSTGDPQFANITSSGGTLTFTFGYNSLNIEVNAPGFTFHTPWTVSEGGTGQTVLTTYGVLIGEGSNNVNVTAAGTNGQVLIASSTGDPAFSAITSTGGTLTFTFGNNSLNVDLAIDGFTFLNPWPVQNGGTGRTILTTYGVLVGEGSNNVNVTAAGTNGQVLIASSTGDPAFSTITSTGGTLTFTFGNNSLNVDLAIDGFTFLNPWPVQNGGTGRTVLTTFGVLIGEGSNNIDVTAAGTNGQVLLAATGADPAFSTLVSSSGSIQFTPGANSLGLDVVGGGIPWIYTTGPTVPLTNNTGYIVDGASLVSLTLPGTAPQGSVIRIHGMGTGLWNIQQNPSVTQLVRIGYLISNSATATAVQSTSIGDSLELLCVTANTQWDGLSVQGNLQMFT